MNPITDGWEKEKPAKKKRVDLVETALLEAGYIIPRNEEEVEVFEEAMKLRKDMPPIPDECKDPDAVLSRVQNYRQTNVMTREQWERHVESQEE